MATSEKSWVEEKERFINPYTFVRLGGEVKRREPQQGTKTGKISCTLTIKTPLAIPDAETVRPNPTLKDHMQYDFFRVNGKPVIPGSQLRGMVRSYYEALSNSCYSINNNNIMSARHSFPRHPGLLKFFDGAWHLYPATKKHHNGNALKKDEYKRVWYDIQGKFKKAFVFSKNGDEIQCENLQAAVDDYNENVKVYEEGTYFKKYKANLTYKLKADASSREMCPVFYEMIGDKDGKTLVYLSPSQIGRSVFTNKIDDLLGTHKSCSKTDGSCLCKACEMFGIISVQKGGQSHASRLRFADAEVVNDTFRSLKNVTLKELSGPKTTSVEFYTQRPEKAIAWTYDSETVAYEKEKIGTRNVTVPVRSLYDVEINGRKFYVHNPKLEKEDYYTEEKTKRNNSMELCERNSQFKFDVYFENITNEQLAEIVWTLALGENSADSDRMFKLGHGKPLGLGSVKVTVDSVETRELDLENLSYKINVIDPAEFLSDNPFDSDSEYYKDFMAIVNFKTLEKSLERGAVISYPIADDGKGRLNSKASHQWFIANRSSGKGGTSTAWSIKHALPRIRDDDLTLPSFTKSGERNNEQFRGKGNNKRDNKPQTFSFGESSGGGFMSNVKIKDKRKNK